MGPIAYTYTILLDCAARRDKAFGGFQVAAGLPRGPCALCFKCILCFSICVFLLAVGSSLNFQFSIGSLPGGARFEGDTRASETHKQRAQKQSKLLDDFSRIHAETHPWVCDHELALGFAF